MGVYKLASTTQAADAFAKAVQEPFDKSQSFEDTVSERLQNTPVNWHETDALSYANEAETLGITTRAPTNKMAETVKQALLGKASTSTIPNVAKTVAKGVGKGVAGAAGMVPNLASATIKGLTAPGRFSRNVLKDKGVDTSASGSDALTTLSGFGTVTGYEMSNLGK